jgi:oligopeptide/dipeptide ABC transporter ATP-binding protein
MVNQSNNTNHPETRPSNQSVVQISELKKYFPLKGSGLMSWSAKQTVKAVDGVSFEIMPNEMFGLAGESGCGKSTVGRLLLGLIRATSGEILFNGENISRLDASALRKLRPKIQMVFQDPYTSLNPRRNVASIVSDPLVVHTKIPHSEQRELVMEMLERVGLAKDHYYRYPHEFSGGQRQRIAIARALILNPDFLVLDEPTSALDVSVQAVIVNLIKSLQDELNLSCLFITHDLNLLRFLSDRLAIMYLGEIVELADTRPLFEDPLHPYSRALIASTPQPVPDPYKERRYLEGEIPSNIKPPTGCRFHPRCPEKIGDICETRAPEVTIVNGRQVRCHLYP